jgi:hypothetical protein
VNNKLIIFLYFILIAVIVAFAYNYFQVQDYKLIAKEKLLLLENSAGNFFFAGFIVSLVSWFVSNYFVVKTKKLFFIWLPLIYVILFSILFGYHQEDIFKFKQDNGMWNGSFSLSYIFSAFFIIVSFIILLINYFILRSVIRKKQNISN